MINVSFVFDYDGRYSNVDDRLCNNQPSIRLISWNLTLIMYDRQPMLMTIFVNHYEGLSTIN